MAALSQLQNFLISGVRSTSLCWPNSLKLKNSELRIVPGKEKVWEYKDRIYASSEEAKYSDHLLMFGWFSFNSAGEIIEASCTAISCKSENIIRCQNDDKLEYYRLDFDTEDIGELFSHSYPHIHPNKDSQARLGWNIGSKTPIFDFFESFVIQFDVDSWIEWAASVLSNDWDAYRKLSELVDLKELWLTKDIFLPGNTDIALTNIERLREYKSSFRHNFDGNSIARAAIMNYPAT